MTAVCMCVLVGCQLAKALLRLGFTIRCYISQAGHEARWLHTLAVIEQMAGSVHSQLLYYVIIQMDGQLAGLM